jgi:hypothetical protein
LVFVVTPLASVVAALHTELEPVMVIANREYPPPLTSATPPGSVPSSFTVPPVYNAMYAVLGALYDVPPEFGGNIVSSNARSV